MPVDKILRTTRIREIKPSRPVCLAPGTTLAETISSMREGRAACALVCEDGRITGIFTERDLLNKVVGEQVSYDSRIEGLMTRGPSTLTGEDTLADAISMMYRGDYRHVPIVDGQGGVAGIISIQHIIEFLAELFPAEVLNLPPRPHQSMESREGG